MANEIKTGDPRGFNKGRSSKFREGFPSSTNTWRYIRRIYRPKRCGNNNKDEDYSPKTLNDKNQQASSQKFRHLIYFKSSHWPSMGVFFYMQSVSFKKLNLGFQAHFLRR